MDIFFAITLYNDKIHGVCSESVLKNSLSLMKAGHTVMPHYNSDLYIDRSRNVCAHLFLKSNCSDLVFIDSDLEFDDDAVLKLIKYDRDIVAGAYRYKKDELEYTMRLDFSRNNDCKEEETGLVYVDRAPTGLMRIKREVFERMIKHYSMKPDERGIYPFFDTGIRFENENNWYGEDSYFCKRFIEMGGVIMVEPNINFTHIGTKKYEGNLHEFLMRRAVDKIPTEIVNIPAHELETVKALASEMESIAEIGCWTGNTTKELLKICKQVYAVDNFKGSYGKNEITGLVAYGRDIYKKFRENVGNPHNLTVFKGDSAKMAAKLNGKKVDMAFIDAGHDYNEVNADIEAWLKKCKKRIAGHDYCNEFPGVRQAVDERFENVKVKDSVWWVDL